MMHGHTNIKSECVFKQNEGQKVSRCHRDKQCEWLCTPQNSKNKALGTRLMLL